MKRDKSEYNPKRPDKYDNDGNKERERPQPPYMPPGSPPPPPPPPTHEYISYPGQFGGNYPPPYDTHDWHGPRGPMYPMFYKPPVDPFGISALTFGIVTICIFWLSIFPYFLGTTIFFVVVTLGGLGISIGIYSYTFRRPRSVHGLVGFILSIIAIVLSSIFWLYTHENHLFYPEYYEMIKVLLFTQV